MGNSGDNSSLCYSSEKFAFEEAIMPVSLLLSTCGYLFSLLCVCRLVGPRLGSDYASPWLLLPLSLLHGSFLLSSSASFFSSILALFFHYRPNYRLVSATVSIILLAAVTGYNRVQYTPPAGILRFSIAPSQLCFSFVATNTNELRVFFV